MTDTSQEALRGFAEALRKAPVLAQEAAREALNAAAELALQKGIDALDQRYNLDRSYLKQQLTVNQQATRTDLLAKISAARRPVRAGRFGADQATTAAPGAKGDPYRGIASGRKAAGSNVWSALKGGNAVAWQNAFFIRGKNSNAWLLINREGPGDVWGRDLKTITGPSVGAAWKTVSEDIAPEAMALAQERFLEKMGDLL